ERARTTPLQPRAERVAVPRKALDTDTPKGTGVDVVVADVGVARWATGRNRAESSARFARDGRRNVWFPSRVGLARYAIVRNASGWKRDFRGPRPRRPPHDINASPFRSQQVRRQLPQTPPYWEGS